MINVLCLIDSEQWAFARRVEAVRRYAPDDFRFQVACYPNVNLKALPYGRYDLIWCLSPGKLAEVREAMRATRTDRPLVGSFNSGPGRGGYHLPESTAIADWVIVNNHAAWAVGMEGAKAYNAVCISNGVDLSTYRSVIPMRDRPATAIWCASESKASDANDIKGHKFILQPLERILPSRGIKTDFQVVEDCPKTETEMARWYNTGSVVVCASSSEGTPNIVLEGAASGCVVVSSHVGNVPELVTNGHDGVIVYERHTGAFFDAIQYAEKHRERLSAAMLETIKAWSWESRSKYYHAVFRKVISGGLSPFSWIDTPLEELA